MLNVECSTCFLLLCKMWKHRNEGKYYSRVFVHSMCVYLTGLCRSHSKEIHRRNGKQKTFNEVSKGIYSCLEKVDHPSSGDGASCSYNSIAHFATCRDKLSRVSTNVNANVFEKRQHQKSVLFLAKMLQGCNLTSYFCFTIKFFLATTKPCLKNRIKFLNQKNKMQAF